MSSTLAPWLRRFLAEYIVTERNLARNTQKSYRDTFALLLPFVGAKIRKPVDRLAVQDLTARRVLQFLDHLEDDRACSVQTRNQRLMAIRAFARFVGSRDPCHLEWSANIRAIALKKATPQPIGWLSKTEMKTLLKVPKRQYAERPGSSTRCSCFSTTPAHASPKQRSWWREICRLSDATTSAPSSQSAAKAESNVNARFGRVPNACSRDLAQGRANGDAVFLSQQRAPYTRFGVYRLVKRCAARVPSLATRTITPHMIRHTSACHLLQAGVDINTIRAWLGHASLDTTNIYAEIDLERKAKAMALCDAAEPGPVRPWKENKRLMAFLGAL